MYNRQCHIMDKVSWLRIATFLYMASFGSTASIAHGSNIECRIPSGCPCPGETVTCECIATVGTQSIEWSGSIFEDGDEGCTSIAIHRDRVPGQCKGIVAYGYSAEPDGHFVSEMNFTANASYNGKTIQCRIDNGPRQSTHIGNVTINITQGLIEPIQDMQLLNATPHHLIFNWTRASINCSSLQYIIDASKDCGICPSHTSSTQIMCSLSEYPTYELKICKFKVNVAVCGAHADSRSNWKSITLTVNLKLPEAPTIKCEPIVKNGLLQSFTVNIFELDAFIVADYMSGSPLSYTIAYFNINSKGIHDCDSVTLMASLCENGLCSHRFQVSSIPSCRNSTHIIVTAFATNVFGNGSISTTHLSEFVKFDEELNLNTKIRFTDAFVVVLVIFCIILILVLIVVIVSFPHHFLLKRLYKTINIIKDMYTVDFVHSKSEEAEVDLFTTHALCLEVKYKDITDHNRSTVPMLKFAEVYLPGYRSEWQCGYYEFINDKPENFTPDQRVLLMTIEEKKIVKLVETTISNIIDDHNDLRNVELRRVKSKRHVFVFIKSRNDDYELSLGQKFLYCAHFSEVCGHVELRYKENDNRTIYQFATEQFKLFREGFAYREVCSEDDVSRHKLLNKSVRLSKNTTDVLPLPARTDVYSSAHLNAHILIQHKFKKLPEHHDNLISSCTKPLDHFTLFIHTSGHSSRVGGRRILFCINMDRIDKCSYSKVGKVLKDSEITCDPTNSSTLSPTHAMPTSNDTDIEEMPMVEFGKKLVGTHYDQQLGYGYREIYQGNNIRLKLYKKVVLMDKDNNLFAGSGAQRLIGLHEGVQEFEVADLSKTHWRQIFVESRGENRKLELESSFLFYVPLTKLDAYHEIYIIKRKCKMFEFAKSKIPGFNPTRGYGYCQITDELLIGGFPQSTVIILMSKEKQLFSGAGAYYYAMDVAKFKAEWECGFVQNKSFDAELIPGTKFLYCEYSQL